MAFDLVVTRPFADFKVGQKITDSGEVDRLLASHLEKNCVKVFREDAPATEETADPASVRKPVAAKTDGDK